MANGRILGKFSWFRMPDEKLKNKVGFKWLKRLVRLGGEWVARKGIMVIRFFVSLGRDLAPPNYKGGKKRGYA